MDKLIIRHDDFDFRLDPKQYIDNHEKFIEYDLIETAVVQFTNSGRVKTYDDELIKYMNTAPNWDLQLHGWEHNAYHEMSYDDIVKEISAAIYFFNALFNRLPTVWYPPWNGMSSEMKMAAKTLDIKIDNESYDSAQFIREMFDGVYKGHSLYYHLWEGNRKFMIDSMLYWARIYEDLRHRENN